MTIEARTVAYAGIGGILASLTDQDRAEVVRVVLTAQANLAAPEDVRLTPRELLLIRLYADGATDHDIAKQWDVAAGTVSKTSDRMRAKLGGALNRAHAVAIAMRMGIIR